MRLVCVAVAAGLSFQGQNAAVGQTRTDSLEIAGAIASRALRDARREVPTTTQLVVQRNRTPRCDECVSHLLEGLDNPVLIVKESVPLCYWDGGAPDAPFELGISHLEITEDHATAYVWFGCRRAARDEAFAWVLEYTLDNDGGVWVVTDITDILITLLEDPVSLTGRALDGSCSIRSRRWPSCQRNAGVLITRPTN